MNSTFTATSTAVKLYLSTYSYPFPINSNGVFCHLSNSITEVALNGEATPTAALFDVGCL